MIRKWRKECRQRTEVGRWEVLEGGEAGWVVGAMNAVPEATIADKGDLILKKVYIAPEI